MNDCCATNKKIIRYEGQVHDGVVHWNSGEPTPVGMSHKYSALLECRVCGFSWTEPRICNGTVSMSDRLKYTEADVGSPPQIEDL